MLIKKAGEMCVRKPSHRSKCAFFWSIELKKLELDHFKTRHHIYAERWEDLGATLET